MTDEPKPADPVTPENSAEIKYTVDCGEETHLAILNFGDGRIAHCFIGTAELQSGIQTSPLEPMDGYRVKDIIDIATKVLATAKHDDQVPPAMVARQLASALILQRQTINNLRAAASAGYQKAPLT